MAAAGMALAPVVIHLIHRRRYQREPWAAMDFLLAAHQTTRRRIQLQHWVLMAVRCIVILLVGATVARPYSAHSALGSAVGQARCDRVIVLDDSLSMHARQPDGGTAFEAAKRKALALIEQCGDADGVALLTASTLPRTWMKQPVHDRQAVRGLVESLTCGAGGNDLPSALREASAILGRGATVVGGRLVYCITDLTKSAIPSASEALDLPNVDRLVWVGVASAGTANTALTEFRMLSQLIGTGIPARYMVRVAHHGSTTMDKADVEVLLDGTVVHRATVGPIPSHGVQDVEMELPISRPGDHRLTARLVNMADDLPEDNVRHLAARVSDTLPVLLVEGRLSSEQGSQGLLYVHAALCGEAAEGSSRFVGTTISASELQDQTLSDYSLVVLGDVPRLSTEAWTRLGAYVKSGGAVMMFLGEQVAPDGYSQAGELLTCKLVSRTLLERNAEPLRFRIGDSQHPALVDLSRHDRGGLLLANVWSHWRIVPRDGASPRTLLSLSDGQPALMEHVIGRGRVVTWLIGPEITDTNLPAKPDYPPLMLNLATHLAAPPSIDMNLTVGHTWTWRGATLRPDAVVELRTPSGKGGHIEANSGTDGRTQWSCQTTDQPGFYSARLDSARALFAVNAENTDSDLRPADASAWRARFGPKCDVVTAATESQRAAATMPPREFASLFGFVLITLVVIETLLATWFGSRG